MKKQITLFVFFFFTFSLSVFGQWPHLEERPESRPSKVEGLDEETLGALEKEAIRVIEQLGSDINALISPKGSENDKNNIITRACKRIFYDAKQNIVQIKTYKGRSWGGKPKYETTEKTSEEYLIGLKKLKYKNAKITWSEALYINPPRKVAGTNTYKGVATVCQNFVGTTAEGQKQISNNCKNIEVIIEFFEDINGNINWRLRLGNIYLAD